MVPFNYNLRSIIARPKTSLSVVLGIGVFVFVITLIQMLSASIHQVVAETGRAENVIFRGIGAANEMTSSIHGSLVGRLRELPGLANDQFIQEFVIIKLFDKRGEPGGGNVTIRGVPSNVFDFRPEIQLTSGRLPEDDKNEVIVGHLVSERFANLGLGESFEVGRNNRVTVVGIFEGKETSFESEIWGNLPIIQKMFGRQGVISTARARLSSPADQSYKALVTKVENSDLPITVSLESDFNATQATKPRRIIEALGFVISFVIALGAIIGTTILIYASIEKRDGEITSLKVIGFSRFSIVISFLLEMALLTIAGCIVGIALGLSMGSFKLSMLNMETWSQIVVGFQPTPELIVNSVIIGMIVGLLGGLVPTIKAARMAR